MTDTHNDTSGHAIFGVMHFPVDFTDFDTGARKGRSWCKIGDEDAIEAIVRKAEAIAAREGCHIDVAICGERAGIRARP